MIECDGYRGRVSSLGYRSTMIETLDGSIIAFQNSQLFNKNFRNMTRNHKFECSKVEVGISYGTDVERARQIVLETLSSLPFLSKVKKTRRGAGQLRGQLRQSGRMGLGSRHDEGLQPFLRAGTHL